jgi:hypothetical protein
VREQRQQETSYIRARRFEGNKGGSKGAHLVAATVITAASPLHGGGGWGLVKRKGGIPLWSSLCTVPVVVLQWVLASGGILSLSCMVPVVGED